MFAAATAPCSGAYAELKNPSPGHINKSCERTLRRSVAVFWAGLVDLTHSILLGIFGRTNINVAYHHLLGCSLSLVLVKA
jgi:hypothetical protein